MPKDQKTKNLKSQLTDLHSDAKQKLSDAHPKAWQKIKDQSKPIGNLINKTKHAATAAAFAGTMAATSTPSTLAVPAQDNAPHHGDADHNVTKPAPPAYMSIQRGLNEVLPGIPRKLTSNQSELVHKKINSILHINAVSQLDGFELNTDYGYMGAEQHLPRFKGDTIGQHDEFQVSGITASRGAFGYFASSKSAITEEQKMQEKYYVAVQSFLSPSWSNNSRSFKKWLKFRKVLVVNPHSGKAVVAVVGDAGPAKWTGKHFGGSPEIIRYINNGRHTAKTTVLLLFVDDPHNQVPLGPVN